MNLSLISIFWTFTLLTSLFYSIYAIRDNMIDDARMEALIAIEKDIVYRHWNAEFGGVYVRLTDKIRPNPYLLGLAERDIVSIDGDTLTMINPAYMTRLVHEIEREKTGVTGHLTSLKLLRPENKPEEWEEVGLKKFEEGFTEYSITIENDSINEYRLIQPLIVEESCLSCHAQQGYKLNDIRGGISANIPLKPLKTLARNSQIKATVVHVVIWLIGVIGIIFLFVNVNEKERLRNAYEKHLISSERSSRELAEQLSDSNKLKELLLDIMSHDIKNPAWVISGLNKELMEKYNDPILETINNSSENLLNTVKNVSALSTILTDDEIQKEEIKIHKNIADIIKEYEPLIKENNMEVINNIPENVTINANPVINEIFRNYLSNAIRYASSGKSVTFNFNETQDLKVIKVIDKGQTIAAEDREKLFSRKERLNNKTHEGTGLGLAIVKRIAVAHDAIAGVEPVEPYGNCFFIAFKK